MVVAPPALLPPLAFPAAAGLPAVCELPPAPALGAPPSAPSDTPLLEQPKLDKLDKLDKNRTPSARVEAW